MAKPALPKRAPHGHDRHIRAKGDHVTKHHLDNTVRHLARESDGPNDTSEIVPGGGSDAEATE